VTLTLSPTLSPSRDACASVAADYTIPSDLAEARAIQHQIEQLLHERQTHEHDLFGIKLALEEGLINAIKHGNQMDRNKKVRVSFRLAADYFEVQIGDEGPGFDPEDVPDPTAVENLERPCGRGLMLMRHYMSEVYYEARGTLVVMRKALRPGKK